MARVLIVLAAVCALACGFHVRRPAPRLDGRIVGGEDANIEDLPYQLSLRQYGSHVCGAAIISAEWVLTAAHCVEWASASSISFRAGSSRRNEGGTIHQASTIIVNPRYDSYNIDYDFALVRVSEPFPIGQPGVQAINLTSVEPAGGATAVVSGWGTLSSGGVTPSQLQRVELPIVERSTCVAQYEAEGFEITERMICAGVDQGGLDSCQGDSGGPLVVDGVQAGVVSWGLGCGFAGFSGVYSNIANQRDWIRENSGI